MVLSATTIQKIKNIIENHYASLTIGILGKKALTASQRRKLKDADIEIPEKDEGSILEQIYYHNYLNKVGDAVVPTSHLEMRVQQKESDLPKTPVHEASREHLNETVSQLIEKHKTDIMTRVEGIIRERNSQFKFDAQQGLADLSKDESVSQIKTRLRDLSRDANRNWERVVNTEVSNSISLGSVDRIVDDNKERDLGEVYVYRIVVNDGALCRWCRRFYLDGDGTPKVYRLSTLLANGSNYGKKTSEWKAVALAVHPNDRCSATIELRPGWKVRRGGTVTFIGLDKWRDYISTKVTS